MNYRMRKARYNFRSDTPPTKATVYWTKVNLSGKSKTSFKVHSLSKGYHSSVSNTKVHNL